MDRFINESDAEYIQRLGNFPTDSLTHNERFLLAVKIQALLVTAPPAVATTGPVLIGLHAYLYFGSIILLFAVTILVSIFTSGVADIIVLGLFSLALSLIFSFLPNYINIIPTNRWMIW